MTKKLLYLGLCLVCMLLSSCSNDMKSLLGQIPAKSDVVAVGSLKTLFKSAGGTIEDGKFVLPKFLADELPSQATNELDEYNDKIKEYGVNPKAVAFAGNFDEAEPAIFFALDDPEKFVKAIKGENFDKDETDEDLKLEIYVDEEQYSKHYIAVHGNYAIYCDRINDNTDAKHFFSRIISRADEEDYASTGAGKYLLSGNVGGIGIKIPKEATSQLTAQGLPDFFGSLSGSTLCLSGQVNDDDVTIESKLIDSDGNEFDASKFKDIIDPEAKISPDALAYLNEDECLVFAYSLKGMNWNKYFDTLGATESRQSAAQLSVIKGYLEQIDGTVALGIGLSDGLQSAFALDVNKDLKQLPFTAVVEVKEGKGSNLINELTQFCQQSQVPCNVSGNSLTIGDSNLTIYVQLQGKFLVLSNMPIKKSDNNPAAKAFNFADYNAAAALVLKKSNKLLQDLDVKNDVVLSLTTDYKLLSSKLTLNITGDGPDGVLAKLFKICIDVASQQQRINNLYQAYREQHAPAPAMPDYGPDVAAAPYPDVYADTAAAPADYAAAPEPLY